MTDLEQQMKAALDGKVFSFTSDGQVKCRDLSNPQPQEIQRFRRPPFKFTTGQLQWLKKNFREKPIKHCAERLGITYDQCYQKVTALRREDRVVK